MGTKSITPVKSLKIQKKPPLHKPLKGASLEDFIKLADEGIAKISQDLRPAEPV